MTGFMIIIGLVLFPYLMKRVQTLTEVFGQHGSATYRLEMMSYSFRLALGRPLLGVGINLSPYYYATGFKGERFLFDPTYPHNLLFQLLAETGVVGLSLFSLFIYLIFQQFFKNLRLGKINEYTLSAGVYLLSAMFYPIFLNHSELSSYFFLYAGLGFLKAKNISSNG
jgi:O-antigen ligase